MNIPSYFDKISSLISLLYLYVLVPVTLVLQFYLLFAYSYNIVFGQHTSGENRLRRSVAFLMPFLMSLYIVYISNQYHVANAIPFPFYLLLIVGFSVGWLFMHWIGHNRGDVELSTTLSCFAASLIFFTTITTFVVTQSFEMISIAFGFLFGVGFYVIVHGFSNAKAFSFPFRRIWEKLRLRKRSSGGASTSPPTT